MIFSGEEAVVANEQTAERRQPVLAALLALALTLAVFHQVGQFQYVDWDDTLHVCGNPYLDPVSVAHVLHFWLKPYHSLFIPVSYTAYSLLALIARQPIPLPAPEGGTTLYDPRVFHIASLALHLVNVLLVFGLLRRIVKNSWAAFGGTLLFALHPAQVESVAWISELRGLLGSCFALLSLTLSLRSALTPADPEEAARRRWLYAGALACFVLALLSKPSTVVTPLFAVLLDAVVARRGLRPILRTLPGWGIAALGCIVMTHSVQHVPADLVMPWWQRPFIAGDALAFSLAETLLPLHLGIDYGRSPLFVMDHPWGYATWLVPFGLGLLLWRLRRRFPMLGLGGLLFVAGLLPTLGFVPFLFQTYSTVADRYLYLALLGPSLMLAWALSQARGKAVPAVAAIVLLALTAKSMTLVPTWQRQRDPVPARRRHLSGERRDAHPSRTGTAGPRPPGRGDPPISAGAAVPARIHACSPEPRVRPGRAGGDPGGGRRIPHRPPADTGGCRRALSPRPCPRQDRRPRGASRMADRPAPLPKPPGRASPPHSLIPSRLIHRYTESALQLSNRRGDFHHAEHRP